MDATTLLFIQLATSLFMTGLIWFVQIVHYPLYSSIETQTFVGYHEKHCRLTTWVVAGPMLLEAFASMLFIGNHPLEVPDIEAQVGAGLIFCIWLATALFSVPNHGKLSLGFSAQAHGALCRLNWLRTLCWTARSVLLMRWVWLAIG